MSALVKSTLKILFRMKGFWFFLLITPFFTTLILSTRNDNLSSFTDDKETIAELSDIDHIVAYFGNKGKCVIKVYDGSKDGLSEYMLNKISESGLFKVCRVTLSDTEKNDFDGLVSERLEVDGYSDRMGAAMFIRPGFADNVGTSGSTVLDIYKLSDDSRIDIFESEVKTILSKIEKAAEACPGNEQDVVDTLLSIDSLTPGKKVVSVSLENKNTLDLEQSNQKTRMGYALAILTLGYVFGGIFIAHICINEQKDCVFTRFKLANMGMLEYFFSKVVTSVIVTFMLTGVMAVCTLFIDVEGMGMSVPSFLLVITLMGLIFSTLSLMLGVLIGDVMSSNVAAFTLWSMSSLLSGLYFPLDHTSDVIKTLSYVMPHKWFMDGTESIIIGDKSAPLMLLCITVAYLVIIASVGSMCLRVKRVDSWGSN